MFVRGFHRPFLAFCAVLALSAQAVLAIGVCRCPDHSDSCRKVEAECCADTTESRLRDGHRPTSLNRPRCACRQAHAAMTIPAREKGPQRIDRQLRAATSDTVASPDAIAVQSAIVGSGAEFSLTAAPSRAFLGIWNC